MYRLLRSMVATAAPGLRPTSLRLITPAGEENGDTWTAEIRLAQVVYVPRSENKLTGQ